ncbi:O-methyltransferase [Fenollaria massiliensis]|uniref:tRNA 5-hydroxyuridine methyltransferase n=1 Tax=Fenollaria massiliensis TaxID=938288 RepID=A0A9E7IXN9_9FIRM|nr:O-methyltransferase [Fenollaria massiliensis]UQK59756.1 O-methyltransferase [Fenollaria massiliensis]
MISQFIDEDVFKYIENFSSERENFKELVDYAENNRVPIVSQDVARFIELLLKIIKPKNILEIGSAIGYSSLIMSKASDANILTIEKDEETFKILKENLKKYDTDNKIKAINDDAISALKSMDKEEKFDFCFIDANKSQYEEYLNLVYDLTRDNALILIDNILFRGFVAKDEDNKRYRTIIKNLKKFIEDVKSDKRFTASLLTVHDGLLLLRKE